MSPFRRIFASCFYFLSAVLLLTPAWGQSKYAPIFEKFQRTGDRLAFLTELLEPSRESIDPRAEVPVLLEVISSSKNAVAVEEARGRLCIMAWEHPLEGESFRPAIAVFDLHLNEAENDENSKWGVSIVALTASVGLQPSPRALALMYRMLEYKDERAQGFALLGLAKLRPFPREAKQVLFSRLGKTVGKASGPAILGMLAYAIDDPEVLQFFVKSAESNDVVEQRIATDVLHRLSPMPNQVVDLFRRLQKRNDLEETVAANVKGAIDRIENRVPVENKD